MSLLDFADLWIARNVPVTTNYGNALKKRVKALVAAFHNQDNDHVSGLAIVSYFIQLMNDYYEEQKNEQA